MNSFPTVMNGFLIISENTPMVLSGDFHPDQGWFSFMAGSIFRKSEEAHNPLNNVSFKQHSNHVRVRDQYRDPYIYTKGLHQWVLPFVEFQRVSNVQWSKLIAADCPGWDRDKGGAVLALVIDKKHQNIQKWCSENCGGRYKIRSNGGVVFERTADYILTKLRFG